MAITRRDAPRRSATSTSGTPRDRFGLADPNLKHLDQNGPLAEFV